ncbi:MAG TPA: NapC/NirT family cytochrome c [Nitrospiraceae bacterium]|nr:NapC/NirT family cytochrome c [Nitrospiraceae bacterium]
MTRQLVPHKRRIIVFRTMLTAGCLAGSPAWALETQSRWSQVDVMRSVGIAAAVAGILLLVLVQHVYRGRLQRGTYRRLLLIGLFVLPMIVTWTTTKTVMEGTKSVQACMSCHVMAPFVNDMENPSSPTLAARHYRNNWIAKDQCYSCHVTYGVTGTVEGKRDGFRHWLYYVTNTYADPIQYAGSYDNSNCLNCHHGTAKWERVKSHQALMEEFSGDRIACIACHGPPHPLPNERKTMAKR